MHPGYSSQDSQITIDINCPILSSKTEKLMRKSIFTHNAPASIDQVKSYSPGSAPLIGRGEVRVSNGPMASRFTYSRVKYRMLKPKAMLPCFSNHRKL
ncbi:hypothetical protein JYU34_015864 [Plutella xylostella]|uniref:Uncharacterized protein n=1 Tax=Plutella xylostella TaxID=51655 RepID=A0ABQ7Q4W3_PLUXY|nr:hypothetical protein JYU34_015864 [Plutella xylostella]